MTWADVGYKCDGSCDWKKYLERIAEMLDQEDYNYAEDTLVSMADWIKRNKHVTPKQRRAIHNIESKPHCDIEEYGSFWDFH